MIQEDVLELGNRYQEAGLLMDFYEKEIGFLKERLAEVLRRNTGYEAVTEAEQFQNQFIVQLRNIDNYRKEIQHNKHLAYLSMSDHEQRVETQIIREQERLYREVKGLEKSLQDIRTRFRDYLLKWM